MEQPRGDIEPEFNLREWARKARISRENTTSRRFSASNIRREDTRSFRSNITISSTASSPGYTLRDEIDPATYSFTSALKALQARSGYGWECSSPDGFALNSKWNEAEKYICNPLSGEVPMECLSAKTLSGRSFRNFTNRITMSAPLIYPSQPRQPQTNHFAAAPTTQENFVQFPIQEKKMEGMTRDVGTQSTPPDRSSSSPSPTSTPSIIERSLQRCRAEGGESPNSNAKLKSEEENELPFIKLEDCVGGVWIQNGEANPAPTHVQVEVKDTREKEETKRKEEEQIKKEKQMCRCRQGGCLSWRSLWMRKRHREKHKPRKKNIFLQHIKGC
ncbi:uncharacterized protein LOC117929559 isoform X1 [Vitis riparia]|uniref:uncharacterized protein LOC117929559 isoform X1 n=1 Tax=Vitis riparia TaxID=96939 RepID=UPI00155A4366|nr:uncharacterized protein LOC117929559 isoform X1 [Vitis riparia]